MIAPNGNAVCNRSEHTGTSQISCHSRQSTAESQILSEYDVPRIRSCQNIISDLRLSAEGLLARESRRYLSTDFGGFFEILSILLYRHANRSGIKIQQSLNEPIGM